MARVKSQIKVKIVSGTPNGRSVTLDGLTIALVGWRGRALGRRVGVCLGYIWAGSGISSRSGRLDGQVAR
jgi:hypothetical protein